MKPRSSAEMAIEQRETLHFSELSLGVCQIMLEAGLRPFFDQYIRSEADLFERCASAGATGLDETAAGRGGLFRLSVPNSDAAVLLRENRRGGVIRFLNEKRYCLGLAAAFRKLFSPSRFTPAVEYRPFCEVSILGQLYRRGLPVPAPAFALLRPRLGGVLYSGAVATWEIPHVRNLLKIVQRNELPEVIGQDDRELFFEIGSLARRVLEEGVYHSDFHLGNILLDGDERLVLIDFDKAEYIEPGNGLRHFGGLILQRWERSLDRHATALGDLKERALADFRRGLAL